MANGAESSRDETIAANATAVQIALASLANRQPCLGNLQWVYNGLAHETGLKGNKHPKCTKEKRENEELVPVNGVAIFLMK